MCGITGAFHHDGCPVDPRILGEMCRAMMRRGPNDEGQLIDRGVGLGMRRLSIIDVAGGHQPISNEDGTLSIVFNGEIFNHESIAEGLRRRGHVFKTRSDTEAILHLFEEEGPGCLRHLRGMFAIAIWNAQTRQLFLARDRLGIKPLHYFYDGRRLVFGSEIKCLLADPTIPRDIDWTGIDAFLTYTYIPAPWTAYRAIKKLAPGHYMLCDEHGLRIEQYWDLPMEPKWTASAGDLAHEFIERFRESVRIRLLSEVPLGAFLSGGVDSSLVVAMMAQSSSQPVNTFTIGFGGETGSFLDERRFAREVAQGLRTNHREFEVQPRVDEALKAGLAAHDEPFADDSIIPTHFICALARQHVTVALTGLGGDENFAGYERNLGFMLSQTADRFPLRQLLSLARPGIRALREQRGGHYRINHLKRFVEAQHLPPAERWRSYLEVFSRAERQRLYTPEIARQIDFDAVERAGCVHFERAQASDPLDRALYQDIKMYLPDDILALTDRVGMWHSLELRVPFTDHSLMEFCARIPHSLKMRSGEKKYLLRKAARQFVPPSVLDHRKQGFAAPMAMWLRGDMRMFVESNLSARTVGQFGVLDPGAVTTHLTDHQQRRRLNDKPIFSMLMLHLWLANYGQPARI
jgi:asparagine synthase (glutamine-hydrolysing)